MKISREIRIGMLTLIALGLGYIGLNFLKGISLFSSKSVYYAEFSELNNVSVSTPVIIRGYKVGSVREVNFGYSQGRGHGAQLTLNIDPKVQLPEGSTIHIKSNMLSGPEVVIQTPDSSSGRFISVGSQLTVQENKGDLMTLAAEKIVPATNELLPVITSMLNRVNDLVRSRSIDSTFISLRRTSEQLHELSMHLNRSAEGMPEAMDNIKRFSHSMAVVGNELQRIKLDSIMINLERTTNSLRKATNQLNSGNSSLGMLLYDPSLYNRLDSLAASAEALMRDIKENPKRYVHVSVF